MIFSKFLLDNYLQTEVGKQGLEFFRNLPTYAETGDPDKKIKSFIDELLLMPLAEEWYKFNCQIERRNYVDFDEFFNDASNWFREMAEANQCVYRDIVEDIPETSVMFYAESQQFAFPYLYPAHFFRIQEICAAFDIILPPLPSKTNYEEKCLYYLKLCKTFYEFRCQYQMSVEEFCVFFYCFAQHFLSSPLSVTVPRPLKSYIVGANKDIDQKFLQTISADSVRFWQGNLDTKAGDIILMYELAPQSHISSIWRAVTDGYDDPFRHYPGVVWIGDPIKIPPISLQELKDNPIWSEKGLVKANMQGVSGRPCSKIEYESIINMLEQKGFDISCLPELYGVETSKNELACERDVEKHLLEPLLKRLGLNENDWLRQMPLHMGRSQCYYPDYVIYPELETGNESGAIVCEAKFRISDNKQLKKDFFQAKSYARRLGCKGIMLVSCEGLWLAEADVRNNFEKLDFFAWSELTDPDVWHNLKTRFDKLLQKKHKKSACINTSDT